MIGSSTSLPVPKVAEENTKANKQIKLESASLADTGARIEPQPRLAKDVQAETRKPNDRNGEDFNWIRETVWITFGIVVVIGLSVVLLTTIKSLMQPMTG